MAQTKSVLRLQRELVHIQAEGISPTIHVLPGAEDMTSIDALVIGPTGTPYDCAMLHFRVKITEEYPFRPPQVRVVSTDGGSLRIHPQLYKNGKVCLSILGTWYGPEWSGCSGLRTLFLSIQSLLTEEPLRCEPGLENASAEAVEQANVFVVHEVARALVLGQLTREPTWGASEEVEPLTRAMHEHLATHGGGLLSRLQEMAKRHDGTKIRNPFSPWLSPVGRYDFAGLHAKLSAALEDLGVRGPTADGPPTCEVNCRAFLRSLRVSDTVKRAQMVALGQQSLLSFLKSIWAPMRCPAIERCPGPRAGARVPPPPRKG